MKIYKDELDIKDQILASASLAYTAEINKADEEQVSLIKSSNFTDEVAQAQDLNDEDLYYHTAILVSTNWNRNNDIFVPAEVWPAKNTPVNKPTNLNHKAGQVVGHMTKAWAIDSDDKLLADTLAIDELPENFRVLVGSVIYKIWHNDEERQTAVNELLEQIEEGKKYVSMECSLNGFDYGLAKENELKIVARNQDTAFLTKHLSAYGGTGEYDGYQVGRVLRNIKFIGKGYVDKPANPESVIFNDNKSFNFAKISEKNDDFLKISVTSNSNKNNNGEFCMSTAETQNKLEQDNKALAQKVEELTSQLSKANVEKVKEEAEAAKADLAALQTKFDETEVKLSEANELVESTKAELEQVSEARDSYKSDLDKMKQDKAKAERVSTLVDGGIDKAAAEEKVETFANLNDEQFEVIANTIIEAEKMSKDKAKMEEKGKEDKEDKAKAEDEVEETTEAEDNTDLDDVDTDETAEASVEEKSDEEDDVLVSIASLAKERFNKKS